MQLLVDVSIAKAALSSSIRTVFVAHVLVKNIICATHPVKAAPEYALGLTSQVWTSNPYKVLPITAHVTSPIDASHPKNMNRSSKPYLPACPLALR